MSLDPAAVTRAMLALLALKQSHGDDVFWAAADALAATPPPSNPVEHYAMTHGLDLHQLLHEATIESAPLASTPQPLHEAPFGEEPLSPLPFGPVLTPGPSTPLHVSHPPPRHPLEEAEECDLGPPAAVITTTNDMEECDLQ